MTTKVIGASWDPITKRLIPVQDTLEYRRGHEKAIGIYVLGPADPEGIVLATDGPVTTEVTSGSSIAVAEDSEFGTDGVNTLKAGDSLTLIGPQLTEGQAKLTITRPPRSPEI